MAVHATGPAHHPFLIGPMGVFWPTAAYFFAVTTSTLQFVVQMWALSVLSHTDYDYDLVSTEFSLLNISVPLCALFSVVTLLAFLVQGILPGSIVSALPCLVWGLRFLYGRPKYDLIECHHVPEALAGHKRFVVFSGGVFALVSILSLIFLIYRLL